MGRLRKVRTHKLNKAIKRNFRLENRSKGISQMYQFEERVSLSIPLDPDQIWVDLAEHREALSQQPVDPDLPGEGQFYDIHCAKYFQSKEALEEHQRSKVHKKQVKIMKERPFDPEVDPC